MQDPDELANRFTYHPPKGDQVQRYETIRAEAMRFAEYIDALAAPSRERSLAMTKLEESVMWANAAVARAPVVNVSRETEQG